jgi:hypothetical protein
MRQFSCCVLYVHAFSLELCGKKLEAVTVFFYTWMFAPMIWVSAFVVFFICIYVTNSHEPYTEMKLSSDLFLILGTGTTTVCIAST